MSRLHEVLDTISMASGNERKKVRGARDVSLRLPNHIRRRGRQAEKEGQVCVCVCGGGGGGFAETTPKKIELKTKKVLGLF